MPDQEPSPDPLLSAAAAEAQRIQQEIQERLREILAEERVKNAWQQILLFRAEKALFQVGEETAGELTEPAGTDGPEAEAPHSVTAIWVGSETGLKRFASAIADLVRVLDREGFAARLDNLQAGDDALKALAIDVYRQARKGPDAVGLRLRGVQSQEWDLFARVFPWMRQGLMREMFPRERAAAPPALAGRTAADPLAKLELTRPDSPARWAKVFGFSKDTLMRRIQDGIIRCKKLSTKSYQIAIDDLPADQKEKFRNPAKHPPK
jgi:hypothetical protein